MTVELYHQMMTKDKMEREERIRRNAQLSYEKAKLPPRMEMHEKIKKQQDDLSQRSEGLRSDFHPAKARDVPDFNKLQNSF